ncbi:CRE-NKCC-1 protein, partial [Aphelenchoides avenae]
MKFERMGEHVKNYRPQILVLTGNPAIRPCLVDFAHNITKGESLMVCGDVLQYASSKSVIAMMKEMEAGIRKWLKQRRVKSFYNCQPSMDLRQGARSLFQACFKQDWAEAGEQQMSYVNDYVGIIHDAFDNEMGVAILRNSNRGFDLSDILSQNTNRTLLKCNEKKRQSGFINLNLKRLSLTSLGSASKVFDGSPQVNGNAKVTRKGPVLSIINEDGAYVRQPAKEDSCSNLSTMSKPRRSSDWSVSMDPEGKSRYQHKCFAELSPVQLELLTDMNRFHERVEKGFIDVWWLYDDGGLTLLVAYLLTQPRSYLENAKLRVYTLSTKPVETDAEVENMKTMLQKFRITFASIIIIPHTVARPEQDTLNEFDRLIEPFRYDPTEGFKEGFISDHQLESNRDQTWHHLRIAEHLRKHSADASLVVV